MEQVPHRENFPMSFPSDLQFATRRSRPKLIPPPLVLQNEGMNLLTEFAIIATSPRSPLMQKNLPIRKRALSCSSMEAIQSPLPMPVLSRVPNSQSSNSNLDEETSSSPIPSSPLSTYGIGNLCVDSPQNAWNQKNWPVPVWHCFLQGTKISFTVDSSGWTFAEDVGFLEMQKRNEENKSKFSPYAPNGLKLVEQLYQASGTLVRLRFRVLVDWESHELSKLPKTQHDLEVECSSDHPFYAKDKGWSSIQPQQTVDHYGIPCSSLEVNDVCLPHGHPDISLNSHILQSIRRFDFTPEDTSAVFALSNMAKHKINNNMISGVVNPSPPASPTKKFIVEVANPKPKRPMNGFMLFAKQHRVEYTHIYPGKDNRAISVLLGDTWKRMSVEERNSYAQKAKIMADETKKQYPDCWKRRRSLSNS